MTGTASERGGVSWAGFEAAAPALAGFVRERLDAHRHRLMATLRRDGSPRLGGIELTIGSGELWVAGLSGSRKFDDLRRDPRVALHSGTDDPPDFAGDARICGRAIAVDDEDGRSAYLAAAGSPPGPYELFRIDIAEVSTVRLADPPDHLVIEVWRPGEAVRRIDRF
jgi:hypothetical protein